MTGRGTQEGTAVIDLSGDANCGIFDGCTSTSPV